MRSFLLRLVLFFSFLQEKNQTCFMKLLMETNWFLDKLSGILTQDSSEGNSEIYPLTQSTSYLLSQENSVDLEKMLGFPHPRDFQYLVCYRVKLMATTMVNLQWRVQFWFCTFLYSFLILSSFLPPDIFCSCCLPPLLSHICCPLHFLSFLLAFRCVLPIHRPII